MNKRMFLKYSSLILCSVFLFYPLNALAMNTLSLFNNSIALLMIGMMIVLLIIIGIMANVLIGAANLKMKQRKLQNNKKMMQTVSMFVFTMLTSSLWAQDGGSVAQDSSTARTITGMQPFTFYLMVAIIMAELAIIIALLINIKFLLSREVKKLSEAEAVSTEGLLAVEKIKAERLSWWDRFNKFVPLSREAELDLGHEYDGIRELNNKLPPWWLYGFYVTILFSVIYMWRYHVSHSGPSSAEEYEIAVAKAEKKIQEYLKKKGESVDENNVTLLTSAEDLAAGKAIFTDPAKCVACHGADGGGNAIGPNLTDDYWIYGGSIKDIFKTIKYGTNKGMRAWKDDLSPKQIAQVSSYIKSLRGTKPDNPREPQGTLYIDEAPPADTSAQSKK
ncbi:MAG: c-type cytochrome [Chitinophagaceae bacterium]|nr:c-type cytochrome [Chitinophagaceae bacterium]